MHYHESASSQTMKTVSPQKDERWDRNYNSDMHEAVDLMATFISQLKSFHPLVYKHIKMLMTDGGSL